MTGWEIPDAFFLRPSGFPGVFIGIRTGHGNGIGWDFYTPLTMITTFMNGYLLDYICYAAGDYCFWAAWFRICF